MIKSRLRREEKGRHKKQMIYAGIIGILLSSVFIFLWGNWIFGLSIFVGLVVLTGLFLYFRDSLKQSSRVRKMENVFPDFLQLMASNLRAGMTIDRAMLLSARKEFDPLDKEIIETGKDIATGRRIKEALLDMAERIGSTKIEKTILLIISGIEAGGNLAVLIEQTAMGMRERGFVEKKAASSVLMYVIFIFVAVAAGAPLLFSLSGILVGVMADLLIGVPDMSNTAMNLPFSMTGVGISVSFVMWFSVVFILCIDVLASLVLGLVAKGEEKEGLKYLPFLIVISMIVYFLTRIILQNFIGGFF